MLYFLFIHCMIIVLFLQVHCTKSAESSIELENQSEMNSEDLGVHNSVGIHDNYRPKHKFKFGNSYQDISKRSSDVSEDAQDDSSLQYAIMFKNNEPVGILQPFEDSYRFFPITGEASLVELNPVPTNTAPTKKKGIIDLIKPVAPRSEITEDKSDNNVAFFDERYPAILAKFKIDSRIAAYRHNLLKRATDSTDISQMSSLKPTMSNLKAEDKVQVEEQLKDILDDMGLIDDYSNREEKREVAENENQDIEDENLELGTNKIHLLKENQRGLRDKRDYYNEEMKRELTSTNSDKVMTERISEISLKDNECPEKSNEVQEDLRERRENLGGSVDISGGDEFLAKNTVSSENEELNSYEKRVEREIRDKIEKLKEEVKKEIENLSKSRKEKLSDDYRRKKRQAMPTLLDEERKEIDPIVNNENNNVHIRRKRHLSFDPAISPISYNMNFNELTEATYTPDHVRKKRFATDNEMYFKNSEETGKESAIDNILENSLQKEKDKLMSAQDDNEASSNGLNQPSFIFEPSNIQKRSCSTCKNCCDKNGKCKCGSQISNAIELVDNSFMNAQLRDSDMNFNLRESNVEDDSKEENDLKGLEGNAEERQDSKVRTPRRINEPFHFIDGEYFIDQHPTLYKLTPVDSVEDFESFKDGESDGSRLYTIKKSIIPHSRFRRRTQTENNQPIQLIDMSAEDIFGALPQSYEGDLLRYKRVKRARIRK